MSLPIEKTPKLNKKETLDFLAQLCKPEKEVINLEVSIKKVRKQRKDSEA